MLGQLCSWLIWKNVSRVQIFFLKWWLSWLLTRLFGSFKPDAPTSLTLYRLRIISKAFSILKSLLWPLKTRYHGYQYSIWLSTTEYHGKIAQDLPKAIFLIYKYVFPAFQSTDIIICQKVRVIVNTNESMIRLILL